MKKLLGVSVLALMLTACSQNKQEQTAQPQQPLTPEQIQQELGKALQECQKEVGNVKDLAKFDACMDKKGFERVDNKDKAQQPKAQPQPKSKKTTKSK